MTDIKTLLQDNWKLLFGAVALATVGAIAYKKREALFGDIEGIKPNQEMIKAWEKIKGSFFSIDEHFENCDLTGEELDSIEFPSEIEHLKRNVSEFISSANKAVNEHFRLRDV